MTNSTSTKYRLTNTTELALVFGDLIVPAGGSADIDAMKTDAKHWTTMVRMKRYGAITLTIIHENVDDEGPDPVHAPGGEVWECNGPSDTIRVPGTPKCECGTVACGGALRGPSHSRWCPVYSEGL